MPQAALAFLSLALGLLLPLGSLPTFALGVWDKAEPLVVAFHAGAALASLAILLAIIRQPSSTLLRLGHPYVLLPLGLGLWSCLTSPFTEMPVVTLLGAPQSGFGALWFLDSAAYTGAALLLQGQPRLWQALRQLALGTALATAALKGWDWYSLSRGENHLLIFVSSYYGWLALALPLLSQGRGPWQQAAFLGVAALLAFGSQSLAVILLYLVEAVAFLFLARQPHLMNRLSIKGAAILVSLAATLPWLILHGLPFVRTIPSLRDRFLIQALVQSDIDAYLERLLTGHGWGRTQDAFLVWLNQSGERLWQPTWTFLRSDYFHSHNWGVEALHAAGVPGLLLALAGFIAIPIFARRSYFPQATVFAIVWTLLAGVWFPLCFSVPLAALGLAGMADDASWLRRRHSRLAALPVLAMGLGQAAACLLLLLYSLAFSTLKQAWQMTPPHAMSIPQDIRQDDREASRLIQETLDGFANRAAAGQDGAGMVPSIGRMLAFLGDRAAAEPTRLPPLVAGLSAMAHIHVAKDLSFAASPNQLGLWRKWLDALLVLAPQRSDLAIPYLTAAIEQGKIDDAMALTDRLLAVSAQDPVGLHYKGLVLLMSGNREGGMNLVRLALDNGIERFVQIDSATRALFERP